MQPIRIVRFWTAYKTAKDGSVTPVDMVEYCQVGMAQRTTTTSPVHMLSKVRHDLDDSNPVLKMAKDRWAVIGAAYNAWKQGNEIPTTGTPIGAWPALSPEQADVLRNAGLRTVEDVANASDGIIGRIQLPGLRQLQEQAKLFLGARDQVRVAADLADKDRKLAEMAQQLEEMRQIMNEQQAARDDSEAPARRGPGRPRKVVSDADEVAA